LAIFLPGMRCKRAEAKPFGGLSYKVAIKFSR